MRRPERTRIELGQTRSDALTVSRTAATLRYLSSFGADVRVVHDRTQAVVAVGSLAVGAVAMWQLGLAWGIAALLACMFVVSAVTGIRFAQQATEAARHAGTRIPPGWNAIVHRREHFEPGQWIPPGNDVIMDPGRAVDDHGNVAEGQDCRVYGGGHASGVGAQAGRPWWGPPRGPNRGDQPDR